MLARVYSCVFVLLCWRMLRHICPKLVEPILCHVGPPPAMLTIRGDLEAVVERKRQQLRFVGGHQGSDDAKEVGSEEAGVGQAVGDDVPVAGICFLRAGRGADGARQPGCEAAVVQGLETRDAGARHVGDRADLAQHGASGRDCVISRCCIR